MAMELALLILYFGLLSVLSAYGMHRLWMAWLLWRSRRAPELPLPDPASAPFVTVQLPLFNERYVAERLVRSVAALRYPAGRLEVQVLDDSTDDTVEIVARVVADLVAAGADVKHVRRPTREGFKAGALAVGLEQARGGLIAVFDADFIPEPDFLERTVGQFADPEVGMVQVRWDHVNRDYSMLTRAQAVLLDGHFVVEHAARHGSGRFFNFNGTAGIWRREAIEDAGGWQHDTLTEDLDLSYRAQYAGWRFVYLDGVAVPAELPVDMAAFKSQQHRWAKGSIQTAKKLLPDLLDSALPRPVKVEALFHLTANGTYLLMCVLSLLMPLTLFVRIDRGWLGTFAVDMPMFLLATLSVCHFYALSQRRLGRSLWRQVAHLPLVLALGVGMSLNNGRAVVEALLGRSTPFVRTPKYDIRQNGQAWHELRYVRVRWIQPTLELLLGLWFVPAIALALAQGGRALLSLPFLVLFQFGFLYVSLASLGQSVRRVRARLAAAA
jgi:cellulose synthase/poly-beta-1,6-N-acetylglucosamine synthase-like glycosyltransferase